MKQNNKKYSNLFLIVGTTILELYIYFFVPNINRISITFLFVIYIILYSIINGKKHFKNNLFYLIFGLGVFLRTIYIIDTGISTRQHDVLSLQSNGHLKYIYILFQTNKLPYTNHWQFYHPPFWHILAALFLKFSNLFGIVGNRAFEGIQILPLIFTSIIMIIVDKINIKLKIKNRYRYLIDLMIAVHPTLLFLSGSINNDCLLLLMEVLVIYLAIIWYENDSTKNTVVLALTTGLCVMTKANGAIMAIPLLYVFFKKYQKYYRNNDTKYASKLLLFGVISLPIGLWFQIRNMILFGRNIVPIPGGNPFLGNYSFIERFLLIDLKQSLAFAYQVQDYNLPAFLLKTSLFGEYKFNNIGIMHYAMIFLAILLMIIFVICILKYLLSNNKKIEINILLITLITSLTSMLFFNIKMPYVCSMDFRYITITLLSFVVILGYMFDKLKYKKIVELICALFITSSIIFICIAL